MARTKSTDAAPAAAVEQSQTTTHAGQGWAPPPGTPSPGAPAAAPAARPAPSRSDGLGIGSPIYEELVAELGDPAA